MPQAKRKQLNVGLSLDQYAQVQAAAEEAGQTVTAFCRDAILDRVAPPPDIATPAVPAWLLHFLLFITRRGQSESDRAA